MVKVVDFGLAKPYARNDQPPSYDVTADGRFVMLKGDSSAQTPISIILNWQERLRARADH